MKRYVSISLALFLTAFLAMGFFACSGGNGGPPPPPPAGVTVTESGTPASTDVTEGGATDTYDVVLDSQPSADVTIAITTDGQTTVNPTSLTFTDADFNQPQTVTVTAFDDTTIEATHSSTISHAATSADTNYDGISIASVTASITDNDGNVSITPQTVNVAEGGTSDTYDVVLDSQPTGDVTITITPDAQTTVNPATLTFTSANFDQAQTVTVTAVDDVALEGTHSSTISHAASSSDAIYDGIPINDATADITDNDRLAFVANDGSDDISVYTADPSSGNLTEQSGPPVNSPVSVATNGGDGPFGIAVHASGGFLYVSNRNSDNISAFSIDDGTSGGTAGTLTELASSPVDLRPLDPNGGQNPLQAVIDPTGNYLYLANIDTDNISAFSIDVGTGTLTEIAGSAFTAGDGARSVAITPSGNYLYSADEFDDSVSAFSIDAGTGALTSIGSFSVATNGGDGPRAVAVDPTGQFLYTANRISDNISAFTIDAGTGALTEVTGSPFSVNTNGGDGPRSLAITAGQFLYAANEFTADISAFTIDAGTGGLAEIAGSPFSTGGVAAADGVYIVAADPIGNFLYVTNNSDGTVAAFTINVDGTLTPDPATEFAAGTGPAGVTSMGIVLTP